MNSYIVQGAGAVSSAIGGCLARAGFPVTLVCRKPAVDAITRQKGIILDTRYGAHLQPVTAIEDIAQSPLTEHTIIFQTMKAQDTAAALRELPAAGADLPVVCWQNGVDNEHTASIVCSRVYGGVVRFTATMMEPGTVRFSGTGKLILGRYPRGIDLHIRSIAEDLGRTSFTVLLSESIMQDKWLKLLINLISCVKPMTRKNETEPSRRILICRNALQEGITVLEKAGITAASTNGTEDSPRTMLANFDSALSLAEGGGQGLPLHNSTWQSLAKHKKILENDWYTGKIIELGRKFNAPTPFNSALLYHLHNIARDGSGPESVSAEQIIHTAERYSRNQSPDKA